MKKSETLKKNRRFTRRKFRVRNAVAGSDRPRLSVYRSNLHIEAQVIDDATGRTLAAASSKQQGLLDGDAKNGGNVTAAEKVGAALAERAKAAGVTQVAFDRGGRKYHGRVKALADAARSGGLTF